MLLGHLDPKKGKICQLVRKPRPALIVRERLIFPKPKSDVPLVITRYQNEMDVDQRLAVLAIEDADNDGLAVRVGEDFVRGARCGSQRNPSSGK